MKFTKKQIDRYSRQIILKKIGVIGQKKLLKASVLIVGAGGLGSPIAIYLAALGIGKIGIIDKDNVEISNLSRQIIFSTNDIKKRVEFYQTRILTLGVPSIEQAQKGEDVVNLQYSRGWKPPVINRIPLFSSIQIQTIEYCNLKCDFCPNHYLTWDRIENKKKGIYYISARLNKEKYFNKIRKQVEQASAISLNHIKSASENELMEALSHYLQALESINPFLDQYPEVNYQSQQKELYPLLVDLINTSNNNISISMINEDVSIKSIVDDSKILKIKCIDKSNGNPLAGIPIKIFWDMENQNSSIITNSDGIANYEIKRIWSAAKNQVIKFQINYDVLYLKTLEQIIRLDPKVFETNINIEGPKIFLSATVQNLGKVIDHKDLSATIKKYFVDLSSAEFVRSRSKADLELKYYINTEERSKRLNNKYPFFVYATGSLSIIRLENNEEIYSINLPESKGADFNQNIIAGKRAIKNLLKEIDDEGLLGLN